MSPITSASGPLVSHVLEHATADSRRAAEHFGAKLSLETDASDLHADLQSGVAGILVLDARSPDAFRPGHIPGAVNLHHRRITAETVAALPKHRLVVTYCAGVHCNASTKAAYRLAKLGVPVKELVDGLEGWKREGYPVESTPTPVTLTRGS